MMRAVGEMPEWPNGTDSKSVVPSPVPRVRIPISPPLHRKSPVDENLRGFFVSANPVFVAIAEALKRVLRGEVVGREAI